MQLKSNPVVLFDGVCNFCNGAVNFLIRQDKKAKLQFAPLQSSASRFLLQRCKLPGTHFSSFVLVQNGKAYTRSGAALRLLSYLPWYWQWARVGWVIPGPLRDGLYNFIARNRYKWFGKKETCMVPDAATRSRFLE